MGHTAEPICQAQEEIISKIGKKGFVDKNNVRFPHGENAPFPRQLMYDMIVCDVCDVCSL